MAVKFEYVDGKHNAWYSVWVGEEPYMELVQDSGMWWLSLDDGDVALTAQDLLQIVAKLDHLNTE